MSTRFTIKSEDTYPAIQSTLKQITDASRSGTPLDLSAATVKFIMKRVGDAAALVNASATIVDASNGIVKYTWQDGDTDYPGVYQAEWEVTLAGGVVTFWDTRTASEIDNDHPPRPLIVEVVGDMG